VNAPFQGPYFQSEKKREGESVGEKQGLLSPEDCGRAIFQRGGGGVLSVGTTPDLIRLQEVTETYSSTRGRKKKKKVEEKEEVRTEGKS